MKQLFLIFIPLIMLNSPVFSQGKFYTKNGRANFRGTKSPLEKIEAVNKAVTCVLDTKTGNIQFSILMKGFEFEKALMQEHFNENYIESHKFPKSEFKGQVVNISEINFTKDGIYTARVKGKLVIHGQSKDLETQGTIAVKKGKIVINSTFTILLTDFKIRIPSLVSDKISETVIITIDGTLEPLKI